MHHVVSKSAVVVAIALAVGGASAPVRAEAPRLFDPGFRAAAPDLAGLPRLRFLTTLDFPPFNFADANRKVTGLNVDLARAICAELGVLAKCEIQAMPWDELEPALEARRGEVILAGSTPTAAARARFRLSEPYFMSPARFVGRRKVEAPPAPGTGTVAVIEGSAHAAMLQAHFPDAKALPVASEQAAYGALMDGRADLIFADGVILSFFLAGRVSQDCCEFVGGNYLDPAFLGRGMVAVVRPGEEVVLDAINAALKSIETKGTIDEIHSRYFPVDPFAQGR